jgi:hypothetical protein
MLGIVAVCLALFRTVDVAESDTLRVSVVEDFDSVAVKDRDNGAGEIGKSMYGQQKE